MEIDSKEKILSLVKEYSSPLDHNIPRISIILAAGHGERLKSSTSKMLYEIWGLPTIIRVSRIAKRGISTLNQIIVVGIKAKDVIETVGRKENTQFVYQKEQKGTGDAVRVALTSIDERFSGDIYIFPGDVGLINEEVIRSFREKFEGSLYHMMLLTGKLKGKGEFNCYGRVIKNGKTGEVIQIKEFKDIVALKDLYEIVYKNEVFTLSKNELLNIKEFNSGIYAFKFPPLRDYISFLKPDNIQKEYYLTDMVEIFNQHALKVGREIVEDTSSLLGFNDRVVLKRMEVLARKKVYDQLKEIVTFEDGEDFFIAEEVVEDILQIDRGGVLIDLEIGKGVYIGKGVKLSRRVKIGRNSHLEGNIILEEGVSIAHQVQVSTYPTQTLIIGENTEVLSGNILKGNLRIGKNCRIESWVRITGSDEYPVRIGNNVLIKGTTYIFGCIIDDYVFIEHSILKRKHIKKKEGVQGLRYIFPPQEGSDSLEDL